MNATMRPVKVLAALAATVLLTTSFSAQAHHSCVQSFHQLNQKAQRLDNMARQRLAAGDHYGYQRLHNTSRVIRVHMSNLPCTSNRICLY